MSETEGETKKEVTPVKRTGRFDAFDRIFGALSKNPYYRTYWFGNQANTLFVQMQQVANGYLAFTMTGSAAALGFIQLAQSLPTILFSPVAGALSDRVDKRNLLLQVQAIQCISSAMVGTLLFLGILQYWHLIVVALFQGIAGSVMQPARQGWIPYLVTREDMPNAIALNNAGLNAARIIGPSVAGVLIAMPWFGVNGIYYLRIVAFAWVLYSLLKIPITGKPDPKRKSGNLMESMTLGYRYIFHHETLGVLFVFAFFVAFFGLAYQQLIPAFALGVFHVGPEGQGLMQTSVGLGALLGSLTMAYISRRPDRAKIQAYTGTALGLGLFGFGICAAYHLFLLSLACLFVVGISADFNATINNTLIMLNTDRSLYGRIMGVYQLNMAITPTSASIFGTAMDHFGGPPVMMINGVVVALFVIGMATLSPGYKKLRNFVTVPVSEG